MTRIEQDERELGSTSSQDFIEAIEKMLIKHHDSKTGLKHEQAHHKKVIIVYHASTASPESEQFYRFSEEHVPPKTISHSFIDRYLRAWGFASNWVSNREWARRKIFALHTHDELLEFMAANDLEDYVDDYYDYLQDRQDELEEGENPELILQSLQSWAWYLIDYALPEEIPYVKVRADFDGCVRLVWRLSEELMPNDPNNEYFGNGKGIISITFYPSLLNYISVMSGAYGSERRRITFRGEFSYAMTKEIMGLYKERLLSPNA